MVLVSLAISTALASQGVGWAGWNVDFDCIGGPFELGGGAPNIWFAGAAGQPGPWNAVPMRGNVTQRLVGTDLVLQDVMYVGFGMSGAGFYYNDPYNLGDYRRLMNDYNRMFLPRAEFKVTGVRNGWYRVYTYAASPMRVRIPVKISVSGSEFQVVTGPMRPNHFEHLVTHSIHDVHVTNNTIWWVFEKDPWVGPVAINGFQVVPLKESGGSGIREDG